MDKNVFGGNRSVNNTLESLEMKFYPSIIIIRIFILNGNYGYP